MRSKIAHNLKMMMNQENKGCKIETVTISHVAVDIDCSGQVQVINVPYKFSALRNRCVTVNKAFLLSTNHAYNADIQSTIFAKAQCS